jgi:uncharacterized protein (DUF697 family)
MKNDTSTIDPRIEKCRERVAKKAIWSAGVSLIPIPGLDIAADITLLMQLIQEINHTFGLTEAQIEALSPSRKALTFKAIQMVGSTVIGSTITKELILQLLRSIGVRFTSKQIAKYVPIAGQAISAALSYTAMRYVCNQHIEDCARVAAQVELLILTNP